MMMRRYLTYFFVPVATVVLFTLIASVVFQEISGDLTRIGRWPERYFGWNAPQPVLAVNANGSQVMDPDVLVLGDSFSRSNLWQSVLARKNHLQTLSFHYENVGCLTNWLQYALDQPTAKTVILQVVERNFIYNLYDHPACDKTPPVPYTMAMHKTAARRSQWPPSVSIDYTFETAINVLRMHLHPEQVVRGELAMNAPVRSECARFSNRRSDRLLYYYQDERKRNWAPDQVSATVAFLRAQQALFKAHGKTFVVLIAPDKLSVYQHCLSRDNPYAQRRAVNVVDLLHAAGVNAPDLLTVFLAHADTTTDLYLPDDTHLSPAGFRLMGQVVAGYLDDLQHAAQAAPAVPAG